VTTTRYKVRNLKDRTYQVIDTEADSDDFFSTIMFQGDLSDCEAWIRLNEGGYLE